MAYDKNGFYNPGHEAVNLKQQWIITFADLFSLILTFFVLLYATTALNSKAIIKSLNETFTSEEKQEEKRLEVLKEINGKIRPVLKENLNLTDKQIEVDGNTFRITLPVENVFVSASSAIKDSQNVFIERLAATINSLSFGLIVEIEAVVGGAGDNRLAILRAGELARTLEKAGISSRSIAISADGAGAMLTLTFYFKDAQESKVILR